MWCASTATRAPAPATPYTTCAAALQEPPAAHARGVAQGAPRCPAPSGAGATRVQAAAAVAYCAHLPYRTPLVPLQSLCTRAGTALCAAGTPVGGSGCGTVSLWASRTAAPT